MTLVPTLMFKNEQVPKKQNHLWKKWKDLFYFGLNLDWCLSACFERPHHTEDKEPFGDVILFLKLFCLFFDPKNVPKPWMNLQWCCLCLLGRCFGVPFQWGVPMGEGQSEKIIIRAGGVAACSLPYYFWQNGTKLALSFSQNFQ